MNEKRFKKLLNRLENNSDEYAKATLRFVLYFETGVWDKGEKPTGEWLEKEMKRCFEKPVLDYINEK